MIFLCIFAILTLYNIFEIKKSFFFHLKYLNTKNLLYSRNFILFNNKKIKKKTKKNSNS